MARREKIEFPGHDGDRLAGLLELPDTAPRATALFAHCFTCGKDVIGASRISRALVARGYAVMRFDFTGLGNSDGDFANTNFSSNVQDLVAAANHLREHGQAPSLLVGHSLGGTAVLAAVRDIPECRAVATIGSPADARHVSAQFGADIEHIREHGEASVNLAGRAFTIRKQFLDDIEKSSTEHLPRLGAALLVLHAPLDETVSIDEAGRLFGAARHPKSFVGLDGADHLLTRAADATWVADLVSSWAARYVEGAAREPLPAARNAEGYSSDRRATESTAKSAAESSPGSVSGTSERPAVARGAIHVREKDHRFLQEVFSDRHQWFADEPESVGGGNVGPDPYEHLLAAIGTCTTMTLRMYAERKKMPLEDARVTLSHSREHLSDCEGCDEAPLRIDVIERDIELRGDLDAADRERLMAIADRCPVHRTLEGEIEIRTREKS